MAVSMILQEYGYTDIVLRKDLRGVVRAVRGKKEVNKCLIFIE